MKILSQKMLACPLRNYLFDSCGPVGLVSVKLHWLPELNYSATLSSDGSHRVGAVVMWTDSFQEEVGELV